MSAPHELPNGRVLNDRVLNDRVPSDIMAVALRRELLRLAALEESLADAEAARVPYWAPCPDSVNGHRAAARALREDADRLLTPAA